MSNMYGGNMNRLSKTEVVNVVSGILGQDIGASSGNWLRVQSTNKDIEIYFSQCKPSSASKGKWTYDFFHTLGFSTVQDIGVRSGILVLLNYFDKTYVVLDSADLMWVVKYSSRKKSNDGIVCDFVIDRDSSGNYNLRPYDRQRIERRRVEVNQWKI